MLARSHFWPLHAATGLAQRTVTGAYQPQRPLAG